jgi:hypothetical protein
MIRKGSFQKNPPFMASDFKIRNPFQPAQARREKQALLSPADLNHRTLLPSGLPFRRFKYHTLYQPIK